MNGRHGRHGESRSAVVRRQKDEQGADEYRVMRIDVVATIPGGDELQCLDVTIRRPTAIANVEGAARFFVVSLPSRAREREKERDRPRHGEADQLRTGERRPRAADENGSWQSGPSVAV